MRTHGSSIGANVSFDSQSHQFFFSLAFLIFLFLHSEKKTKVKGLEGVTHSGRATSTSASCDELTDNNCELGAEGEEMDTTEDADAVPEADGTDNRASRYGGLDSPADRYVSFPSTPFFSA